MTTDPPRKLKVFLCHSSHDKPAVREIYARLKAEGWIDPWLDDEKLFPGQDWDLEIEKAVRATDAVVVFLSNNSVDKDGYIQHEIRLALRTAGYKAEGAIFIIPLRLDNCAVPMRLELQHYVNYFPEERKEWAYGRLLGSLKMRAKKLGIDISAILKEQEEKRKQELAEKKRKEQAEKDRKEKKAREAAKKAEQGRIAKEKRDADEKARLEKEAEEERERKAVVKKVRKENITYENHEDTFIERFRKETKRRFSQKKIPIKLLVSICVSFLFGWVVLGYMVMPVSWTDITPELLLADYQQEYLRMTIDSFLVNRDTTLALRRWQNLGEYATTRLQEISDNPESQDKAAIDGFTQLIYAFSPEISAEPSNEEISLLKEIFLSILNIIIYGLIASLISLIMLLIAQFLIKFLSKYKTKILIGVHLLAVLVGLYFFGWKIPNPPSDDNRTPIYLSDNYQREYLRMTMDSFLVNDDTSLALQRWDDLGENASVRLEELSASPGPQSEAEISGFEQLIRATENEEQP